MARQTLSDVASVGEPPALEATMELFDLHWRLLEPLLALQAAWISSWWSMQSDFLRDLEAMGANLPAWAVWHNGTEQLA